VGSDAGDDQLERAESNPSHRCHEQSRPVGEASSSRIAGAIAVSMLAAENEGLLDARLGYGLALSHRAVAESTELEEEPR